MKTDGGISSRTGETSEVLLYMYLVWLSAYTRILTASTNRKKLLIKLKRSYLSLSNSHTLFTMAAIIWDTNRVYKQWRMNCVPAVSNKDMISTNSRQQQKMLWPLVKFFTANFFFSIPLQTTLSSIQGILFYSVPQNRQFFLDIQAV